MLITFCIILDVFRRCLFWSSSIGQSIPIAFIHKSILLVAFSSELLSQLVQWHITLISIAKLAHNSINNLLLLLNFSFLSGSMMMTSLITPTATTSGLFCVWTLHYCYHYHYQHYYYLLHGFFFSWQILVICPSTVKFQHPGFQLQKQFYQHLSMEDPPDLTLLFQPLRNEPVRCMFGDPRSTYRGSVVGQEYCKRQERYPNLEHIRDWIHSDLSLNLYNYGTY